MRKNLITMGLVSALGASTSAWAIDLDPADADTPVSVAGDSITTGAATVASTTSYSFTGSPIETTNIGVGVSDANQVFVRLDLTNAIFDGAVAAGDITVAGPATAPLSAVAQGGSDGSTFVIFSLTADTDDIEQTDTITVTSGTGISATGSASVNVVMYETLTQAVNQTDSLYSISGTYVSIGSGLDLDITNGTQTAEVSTDFVLFVDTGGGADTVGPVPLGSIAFDDTGATVTLLDGTTAVQTTDILADDTTTGPGTLTIATDGSAMDWGTWTLNDATDCTGNDLALTLATDDLSVSTTLTDEFDTSSATDGGGTADTLTGITAFGDVATLCVTADNTTAIPESVFTATMDWNGLATLVAPPADGTGTIGTILRNGTEIQIPYLTTFSDYNQRISLVNRGTQDASYNFTFTPEDGTTATAGTAASGTIPAGESIVIRSSNIVTLTGTTRTAATVTIVAADTDIDAASNQVNLSDASTDTVLLDVNP